MDRDAPENWFEDIYAATDTSGRGVPWDRQEPSPLLVRWLDGQDGSGAHVHADARALVVGCGLGDDAAELARRGLAVTAFDVAESAIALCRERWAAHSIDWHVCELFGLPESWRGAFDLVVEHRTIQSLPPAWQARGMARVASTVAPGGALVVICDLRAPGTEAEGPPWRLRPEELVSFTDAGLAAETQARQPVTRGRSRERLLVVYRRPHGGGAGGSREASSPGPDGRSSLA